MKCSNLLFDVYLSLPQLLKISCEFFDFSQKSEAKVKLTANNPTKHNIFLQKTQWHMIFSVNSIVKT